jgi:hypothetical protein
VRAPHATTSVGQSTTENANNPRIQPIYSSKAVRASSFSRPARRPSRWQDGLGQSERLCR